MDWMPTGEYGPGSVTGTRVVVEPMGTPVGSLEDFFGIVEDTTPAGTAPLGPRRQAPRPRAPHLRIPARQAPHQ